MGTRGVVEFSDFPELSSCPLDVDALKTCPQCVCTQILPPPPPPQFACTEIFAAPLVPPPLLLVNNERTLRLDLHDKQIFRFGLYIVFTSIDCIWIWCKSSICAHHWYAPRASPTNSVCQFFYQSY